MKKEPYLESEVKSEDLEPGTMLIKGSPPGDGNGSSILIQGQLDDGYNL